MPVTPYRDAIAATADIYRRLAADGRLVGARTRASQPRWRRLVRDGTTVPVYADPLDGLAVPVDLLQTWTARLVDRLGTPDDIAADVAEVLVASDRRGIASHGTARLPNYVALDRGRGHGSGRAPGASMVAGRP